MLAPGFVRQLQSESVVWGSREGRGIERSGVSCLWSPAVAAPTQDEGDDPMLTTIGLLKLITLHSIFEGGFRLSTPSPVVESALSFTPDRLVLIHSMLTVEKAMDVVGLAVEKGLQEASVVILDPRRIPHGRLTVSGSG